MNIIVISLLTLLAVGSVSAIILYFVAKKFVVEEDPRIDEIEAVLAGANCGGCGYPGCRNFATACVKSDSLDKLLCPVGGASTMEQIADMLGMKAPVGEPKIAVVRCDGDCNHRPRNNHYDGVKSCAIAHNLYTGETGCSFGCLGWGDCELSCKFDAIHINPETLLPVVDEDKCTACGACVKACPKMLIELRKKGPNSHRIYVSCMNKEKGSTTIKHCSVGCIACSKCTKVCEFDAITVSQHHLAYIDDNKCTLCGKCVEVCPTSAIVEKNKPKINA